MTSEQCNDLWPKFHDIIIHDNTLKTNRYKIALSLFVVIDNNYKIRIVAQVLTKYETQVNYNYRISWAKVPRVCCNIWRFEPCIRGILHKGYRMGIIHRGVQDYKVPGVLNIYNTQIL